MNAYYNEIDPYAAQWLKNLITAGYIAPGIVDTRSIEDVRPEDINGFTQCHFFAGIGAWSYALRLAGWPDDLPVWTGSCPCQPFSTAGKGVGFADERHLWPAFHHLIQFCQPPVVFGEQVAGKNGRTWLSLVHTDMEGMGYQVGAADLCAAGVGAPHIRQRLYWVAQSDQGERRQGWAGPGEAAGPYVESSGRSEAGSLAQLLNQGLEVGSGEPTRAERQTIERGGNVGPLVHATSQRSSGGAQDGSRLTAKMLGQRCETAWSAVNWLPCRDGKSLPVEPGTFPLAHGAPSRVGRLRAYGNAIVPQVAEVFIRAYLEAVDLKDMLS